VLEQDWIQGGFDLLIAQLERGASARPSGIARRSGTNIAMEVHCNIYRGQCIADVIAASRLPLFLQSRR